MSQQKPPVVIASLLVQVIEKEPGQPPVQRVEGPFNDSAIFVQLLHSACQGFVALPGSPAEINDLLGKRRIVP